MEREWKERQELAAKNEEQRILREAQEKIRQKENQEKRLERGKLAEQERQNRIKKEAAEAEALRAIKQ